MARTADKKKEIAAVTDNKAQEEQKEDIAGTVAEALTSVQEDEAAIDGSDRAKEEESKEQQEVEEGCAL